MWLFLFQTLKNGERVDAGKRIFLRTGTLPGRRQVGLTRKNRNRRPVERVYIRL